jgi:hypothetical protein
MFDFFRRNKTEEMSTSPLIMTESANVPKTMEIPEHLFIENEKEHSNKNEETAAKKAENNIELLFDFLDKNHETKGYEDALMNPDVRHLDQNIEALKNQLDRTIRRVKTFYEDFIKEIDFHIDSRSRSGMVDVVDELKMKKSIAESHVMKVLEIENEHRNNTGDSQGMIITYTRGFMNGLSAISHHTILKRF